MNIDEQIKILQAYKNGKPIEIEVFNNGYYLWITLNADKDYTFDFRNNNYRIKQKPKIRPYKDAKEFLEASKEHGLFIDTFPLQLSNCYNLPIYVSPDGVRFVHRAYSFSEIKKYHWQDGTPCGVEED